MDLAPATRAVFLPLKESDDTSYVLSRDLRLVATNAGWDAFARANGGDSMLARWTPGSSVLDATPAVLHDFYTAAFDIARATGASWSHEYECSSPELYRRFRMIVFPVADGFVVTHGRLVEQPHARGVVDVAPYVQQGVVRMCAHCRRVHHPEGDERWDWVPALVARMPDNVSHGLCPVCAEFLYGDVLRRSDRARGERGAPGLR